VWKLLGNGERKSLQDNMMDLRQQGYEKRVHFQIFTQIMHNPYLNVTYVAYAVGLTNL
jgi:hypothetical protein